MLLARAAAHAGRFIAAAAGLLVAVVLVALTAGFGVLLRRAAAGAARTRARARTRLLVAVVLVALLAGFHVLLVGTALVARFAVVSHDHSFQVGEMSCLP